ncbi:MAG: hypothetical protein RLZZ505_137 [Verrucomicrobiota bacterium]|jgi:hypothetical protein
MKSSHRSLPSAVLSLAMLTAPHLCAVDYSWTAPLSGAWSRSASWGSALAPNAPDANALIAATGSPYTVFLRYPIQLNNLDITSANAILGHTAGTMSLGGVATLTAGRYYLNGGTISGGTIDQNGGVLDFGPAPGNTLSGVTVNGGIRIALGDGSVRFINNSVFNGNAVLDGTSNTIQFGEDVTIDNQAVYLNGQGSRLRADGDWTVDIGANGAVYMRGASCTIDSAPGFGRIRNDGQIISDDAGNTVSITPQNFENRGRIDIRNGSIAQIGDGLSNTLFVSESIVDARNGGMRLGGKWRNEGTIRLENSNLWLGGKFGAADIGTVVRDGTSNTILIGEIDNAGNVWDLAGSTGDVRLDDCTISRCTVRQSDGARLMFGDGSVRFISDSIIEGGVRVASNDGSVRFINGSTFRGSAIVDGTSNTLIFGEAITLEDQEFHLNGAGNVLGVDGNYTVTLGKNAKVYLRGDRTRIADDVYTEADPTLVNYGLIQAEGPGTRYISMQDFGNRGDVVVTDGAAVEIGDGASNTFLFGESRVSLGDGSVRFISETVNEGVIEANRSDIAIEGPFTQNDGSVRFINSTIDFDVLARIAGGEFRGTGEILGDIDFTGGTFGSGSVTGPLTVTGNISATNTCVLAFDLGENVPGAKCIDVDGTFTVSGGTLGFRNCEFTRRAGLGQGTYILVGSRGLSVDLDETDLSGDLGGFTGTLGTDGDNLILTVVENAPNGESFAAWIDGFGVGALTGFNDDSDGDGSPNGVEYFFGTNPSRTSRGIIPGKQDGNTFTFTHPRNTDLGADVAAAYRWSKNLSTYHEDGKTDAGNTTVTFGVRVNTPVAGIDTVTATVTGTPTPRLFVGVRVSETAPASP